MKRRELMGYAGTGLVTALLSNLGSHLKAEAQSQALSVQWLGHTCFLFTGSRVRILVNPFHTAGCTAGYRPPRVEADLVMISSQLRDEGAVDGLPGTPKLVNTPGAYEFKGIQLQGITIDHDRKGGKQFGMNTAWSWEQGGIKILHLGGAAGPIGIEQQILMGRPDLLLIPVGGSDKAYNAQEAQQVIGLLNPKLVIPTHYRTQAANDVCDLAPVDEFLSLMQGMTVSRSNNDIINISANNLPEKSEIRVLTYKF
ncbi:MBL fold metallo-hydrolase [Anabaenopsis elenkinii]|uniref:MBL fold metallo-hydrolase n=1 Tax=Anabaenopsis elenkinii CCIBt3563 TaxID=2779889 RepID=A0A7S6RDW8_9CYAN|nr:MBL fold metallo-hydrolase [Anabaenopsis elenkinii]QOV22577.1 MBL fold metallo-hydrolase [Anabaenopsis elenkinii CCIBt3563]